LRAIETAEPELRPVVSANVSGSARDPLRTIETADPGEGRSNLGTTSGYECTGALFTAVDINELNTLKSEEGCIAAMEGLGTQLKGYHCLAFKNCPGSGCTCEVRQGCSSSKVAPHEALQTPAPGIKGSLCDKCATSCKANGQECPTPMAPEDVPVDKWEAEWIPLVDMGGCAAIPMNKGMGITCATDLSTSMAAAFAPDIKGTFCDKCATSCKADGQECPTKVQEDVPQDQWGEEWTFIKDLGGCGAIDAASVKDMGLTCTTDLAAHAALQASALATTKACLYGVSDAIACIADVPAGNSSQATSSATSRSSTTLIAISTVLVLLAIIITSLQ